MNRLARDWRIVALRGALGIVAGIIAIFLPGATLAALVIVFGAYAFVNGIAFNLLNLTIVLYLLRRSQQKLLFAA